MNVPQTILDDMAAVAEELRRELLKLRGTLQRGQVTEGIATVEELGFTSARLTVMLKDAGAFYDYTAEPEPPDYLRDILPDEWNGEGG